MPEPKPKKVGRPALPKGEAKGEMLRIRVTPKELRTIEANAKAKKQSVSDWVRDAVEIKMARMLEAKPNT
jgi:predicted HicB family RNase H-like nuclease